MKKRDGNLTPDKIKKAMDSMIKPDEFLQVTTGNLEKIGINKGDLLYTVSLRPIPEDENDLYTQRVKFIVMPIIEEHIKSDKVFLVDPRNVERVGKRKSKKLRNIMQTDFAPKEEENKEAELVH